MNVDRFLLVYNQAKSDLLGGYIISYILYIII